MVEYEMPPTKIEASQKGWLSIRALAKLLDTITHIEADYPYDWLAYYEAKKEALRALIQFERWHGKG